MTHRPARNLFLPAGLTGSVGAQAGALVIGRGIGLVRGIALTWLLTQREFGVFQVAVAVVNLLVPLTSLGLSQGILRYAPAHEVAGTLAKFSRRAAMSLISIGAASAVVLLLAPKWVTNLLFSVGSVADAVAASGSQTRSLVVTAIICTFSLLLFHLVVDLMKGLRLFRAAGLMEIVGVVLFSGLAVAAPAVGYDSADVVLLMYGLGNAVTIVFFAAPLIRYIRSQRVDADASSSLPLVDRRLLRYSLWIAASQVAWHAMQQYVLWHLALVGGSALAATFFAVRLFAQLVLLSAQTVSRSLSANVTRVWEATSRQAAVDRLETGSKAGILIVLAGVSAMALFKPLILRAFPEGFAIGRDCFEPLLLAYGWLSVLEFLVIRFYLEEQSVNAFIVSIVGALANVALAVIVLRTPEAGAGLDPAALLMKAGWVCAAAAGITVLACIIALHRRGHRPQFWTVALAAAAASIGAGGVVGLAVFGGLACIALFQWGVFTPAERAIIVSWRSGR